MNSLKLIDRILTAPLRRSRRRVQVGVVCAVCLHLLITGLDIHRQYPSSKRNGSNASHTSLFQYLFYLFTKNDSYAATQAALSDESKLHQEKGELDHFLSADQNAKSRGGDLLTNPPKHTNKNKEQHNPFAPPFHRRRTTSKDGLLPNPLPTRNLLAASGGSSTSSTSPTPSPAHTPSPNDQHKKLTNKSTGVHLPKTLVLDLDETLIHSTSKAPTRISGGFSLGLRGVLSGGSNDGGAHMVEVVIGGRSVLYHVYKRPHLDFFLKKVASWYTLVVFTASMQEYADPVIDWIDGGRGVFAKRLFRESCTQASNGSYMKDLDLIDKDLSRVALVDNSPISYSINPANGIPISGWISDPNDEALLDLLPFLDSLRFTTDVRRVLGVRGFT
ncbi:hypothetical protein E3P99_03636 [Wallemia hederae]|uniref:FCP1 homology domain-containing protein n=1 Tax=Wallemia hederae TaxID=1540922 RepID=A0A4T0FF71_9BASI|nr:hypothetical protein E3P99_03636 [Wallemia hederae]